MSNFLNSMRAAVLAALLAAGGCGFAGGESGSVLQPTGRAAEAAEPIRLDPDSDIGTAFELEPPPRADDLKAVNELIPNRANLEFELSIVELAPDRGLEAFAPVPGGWNRHSYDGVEFDPPNTFQFGFLTSHRLELGCGATCSPQDWETFLLSEDGPLTEVIENAERGALLHDRDLAGPLGEGQSLMARFSTSIEIDVFRWSDDAPAYLRCSASIDSADSEVADAFLAACESAEALWFSE